MAVAVGSIFFIGWSGFLDKHSGGKTPVYLLLSACKKGKCLIIMDF